jgi:putative selenate reductase
MRARGAGRVDDFIRLEAGDATAPLAAASLTNHGRAAARVLSDPRYTAAQNSAVPRRLGSKLWFFDCVSCDKCVPVCPNDANFTLEVPVDLATETTFPDLRMSGGELIEAGTRVFGLKDRHQIANFADFCNECGNCDVFCPEEGGPYLVKPRFFGSRAAMLSAPPHLEGFAVEREGSRERIIGRHQGQLLELDVDRSTGEAEFDDGKVRVGFAYPSFLPYRLLALHEGVPEGHAVRLDHARALAALLAGVLAEGASSPVNAAFLAQPPG